MMNFDYLQKIPALSDLYRFCKIAEETQVTDHDACGWNCRKALEWLVRAIYKLKHVPVSERDNLYTLTTGSTFTELVSDERLIKAVHYIRKVGNVAVHDGNITQRESFFALLNLYNVVGSVLLRLGVLETLAPFSKELIPTKTIPHVAFSDVVPEATKDFVEAVSKQYIAKPVSAPVPIVYSELETRKRFIDLMLREAGWEVLSQENTPFACKAGIEIYVEGMPNKKEEGYCDYVLFGRDCKPLAVIEAKRTSVEPEKGKHQAELYADCLEKKYGQRPVIYYSNGFRTMIIDGLGYPPRQVMGFHTLEDLELMMSRRGRNKMTDLAIKEHITNRGYQKMAIRSVCDHLNNMHRRALLVMATGTGKTRVAVSLCEVLLRNRWVKNVLFLADRTALVKQANESFTEFLPDYTTCILTGAKEEEKKARLMFSTYNTMMNYIDSEEKEFSIGRFDMIILDEAHRSVYGKYTAIFDYFDSFLVGLTATPREEVEKSTFSLFHLGDEPNFEYSMKEAVEIDKTLVGFVPISKTTTRMREGIKYDSLTDEEKEQLDKAWEYEQMKALMDEGVVMPKTPRDIEKNEMFEYIYNKRTVDIVIQSLMNEGLKVQSGNKIGKSIIFAYDHPHAQMIVERFYELYPSFGSDFCQLVDYQVKYPQDLIAKFKKRDMLPQIAVSVDMLDTGIDVPDILNLVFFKPVYSKIKYIQMIGRGTRPCQGIFDDGSDKQCFYIFDWCENFEYFGDNTKGKVSKQGISLAERLFGLKTDIAVVLQHQHYQQEEYTRNLCQQLKDSLYEQVCQLNEQRIDIRREWEAVDKWKKKDKWVYVSELDALELKDKIAPLIVIEDDNNGCLRFDAMMLNIELANLQSKTGASNSMKKVTKMAFKLQSKASIPAVQKHMDTIMMVSNPNFWKDATIDRLEMVREELRELVYILIGSKGERFFIDISDTMEDKGEVLIHDIFKDYKTKILDYLNEHRDHAVIQKIFKMEQLSVDDIKELERICWKELGTKEEYEDYVKKGDLLCGDRVAVFIRSVVGIDRKIAKERFSKFLSDNVLNTLQEEFINQIIGYVCENGDIEPMTIVTNENFEGIDRAFGMNMVFIRKYVEELHRVIA